jgi:cytochrome P450
MTTLCDDLMAPDVIRDPHTYYHQLRAEDPVHWNELWGGWILTRYDDVVEVLRDSERFSSDRMAYLAQELSEQDRQRFAPIFDVLSQWMVFRDPPDHTRLRRLLNTRFTPRAVEQYRPRVRSIVKNLLDEIEPRGGMELVHEFSYLVPLTVILELLGAPELDRDLIKEWSEQLGVFFFLRADEPRRREIACEGVNALVEYLKPLVAARRKQPTLDLISALVAAEDQGDLTEQEVISTCILLVFGGHETTMNLINNGTLALIRHPDQWRRLHEEPEEVGGKVVRPGDKLLVALSAANRDPAQFPDPDALDITRDPNPHVAFAHGIHVCLGAPLARLEAQEAFSGLTQRLPMPRLRTEELDYHPTVVSRALKTLPIEF